MRTTAAVSPTCLRNTRSVMHATPVKHQRVSFHPEVLLYRIKHHRDYPDDEWHSMWVDAEEFAREKHRNMLEFRADGGVWCLAKEEDEFHKAPDGSLHHPATWNFYHRQRRPQPWAQEYGRVFTSETRLRNEAQPSPLLPWRWSPRPKQHKSFWLLDLAMESIQNGKSAARCLRPENEACSPKQFQSLSEFTLQSDKPRRQADRGWP